jgi:hypothetical protein
VDRVSCTTKSLVSTQNLALAWLLSVTSHYPESIASRNKLISRYTLDVEDSLASEVRKLTLPDSYIYLVPKFN